MNTPSGGTDSYALRLNQCLDTHRNRSARVLLDELPFKWGVPWLEVGRMIESHVPSICRWRFGLNGASEDQHARLAGLVAFCEVLSEVGLDRPCFWLSKPLMEGYSVTPRHVYRSDSHSASSLIAYYAEGSDGASLLNRLIPNWKTQYATN